ncbi:MAG TPA: hypothetical protein DEA30_00655 [Acholeplasmataceae bacterium]|nr:hypothetical protein [Acholeplasmataceae bacterium]HBO67506.1 hypothetical protein [Acholeplasmataceae bacterium]HBS00370.1 hypothetical protein [Acholeplasmataceae bacterium]HCB20610.1 hypothetical protein [Acholeplasmataceae bacterium]
MRIIGRRGDDVKKLGIFLIIAALSFSFFVFTSFSLGDSFHEMMILVDSEEEALRLEELHEIELTSYSTNGFATYSVSYQQSDTLLSYGFEYNSELKPMAKWIPTTSDPYINDQYALDLMDVTEAWTSIDTAADVIVAIVDTGIDTDHEEFTGRILQTSYNARTKVVSETSLSHVEDDNGHGTMVAGIIAANKNNSKGVAGIVQGSKLLVIKANNADNPTTTEDESDSFLESSIAEAIHYARLNGADIINLSLGTSSTNTVTKNAIDQALADGIIIVGASGNDGDTTKYYPASYPGVISVGSVDSVANISSFSNYNDAVDVSAPGSQIVSTTLNNGYASGSGTSFAAPQVAGVLALMKGYFPTLNSSAIITQLQTASVDRGAVGYDQYYGYGIVNAAQALQIQYVTITFDTAGGTAISPLQVVSGYAFNVEDPIKEGHTFQGWYLDSSFQNVFTVGTDTTTNNLTLYAKFNPNLYEVSLVVNQSLYQTLQIYYGNVPSINDPVPNEGYVFVGWYYDIQYLNPYLDEPITGDITLYAKFDPALYTIQYYVNGLLYETDELPYLTVPETPTPYSIFPFAGWYYDTTFIESYTPEPITSSFNLYARFNDGTYTVTFYDFDLSTILSTEQIYYGFPATAPNDPVKPNSPSFSYVFTGWSESFDEVTEDLIIYPLYEKTYIKESISLLPGIDTVNDFNDWNDAGIFVLDDLLSVQVEINELDMYYQIIYKIYEGDLLIDTRYRMVTIDQTNQFIQIELLPGVDTIEVGETYIDQGATSNVGVVVTDNQVDDKTPGIYLVIYEVTLEDITTQRTRYVYVLESESYHPVVTLYIIPRPEGWWLQ